MSQFRTKPYPEGWSEKVDQLVKSVIASVGVAAVAWTPARLAWRRVRPYPRTRHRELLLFVGVCYAAAVIAIVILPLPMTSARVPGQITNSYIPILNTIARLREAATTRRFMLGHEIANTIGNIIMFAPAGVLLPLLFERMNSMRRILIAAFCISVAIESAQLISRSFGVFRSVDVDDVILNVLGAAIGYGLYCLFRGSKA